MATLEIKTDGTVEGTTITDDTGAVHATAVSVTVKGGPMEGVSIVANMSGGALLPMQGSGSGSEPSTTPAPKRKAQTEKEE